LDDGRYDHTAPERKYMKKKNLILLSLVCILSLCVFTGLLVYAFELQTRKDKNQENTVDETSEGAANEAATPTIPPLNITPTETVQIPDSEELEPEVSPSPEPSPAEDNNANQPQTKPIVLAFAGDINLDESSKPVAKYDSQNKGILGGISSDLVKEMNDADIMMLNNEFPYSTRGKKTPDKSYTFRADPKRVGILGEMGVDIVSLANNHALDYGPDALEDTFTTLDEAGIDYIGAGMNMDRAKAPIYYTINDMKIAYLAASRVVFAMDWYATDTRLGMIGTYDPTLFLESIKEAEANSDYVVVYLHWGKERENYPQQYQRTLAKQYIDAGADAVIGCHPHVLQGFEFYKGKPIAYSLGNYWFNNTAREAGLMKVYLDPDGSVRVQLLPTMGENTFTDVIKDGEKRKSYFKFMEKISYDVSFDKDGFVTEKAK
jgi:poly-gamma-glutamate synthesis protein (capsule biosynthesis protein)